MEHVTEKPLKSQYRHTPREETFPGHKMSTAPTNKSTMDGPKASITSTRSTNAGRVLEMPRYWRTKESAEEAEGRGPLFEPIIRVKR